MFTFTGQVGRARFALGAGLRIGLFVASIAGFPLVLAVLAWASGCARVGGACGAVGLVAATAYKPLATVVFVFSFLGISIRRARDAGATGWAGLPVPILLAADYDMLTVFGSPGSLSFTMGVLSPRFPVFALLALGCVAILCALPTRYPNADILGRVRTVPPGPPPFAPPSRLVVFLALVITIAAFSTGLGREMAGLLPIMLMTGAVSIVLPTFLLYLAPLWAGAEFVRKPRLAAALLLAASLTPFLHWAYAHRLNAGAKAREEAAIAAISVSKPARLPDTLVFEGSSAFGVRAAWALPGISRVITKERHGSRLMAYARPVGRAGRGGPVQVDALPAEHLLLKVGRASALATKGANYGAAGGPYELRFVSPTGDDLLGAWWQAYDPPPTNMPLLTSSGWFRGSNSATTDQITAGIEAFLLRSLDLPRSAGRVGSGRSG